MKPLVMSIFFLGVFAGVVCWEVAAQGVGSSRGLPGSSGGQHTIKGRIYTPAGRPYEKPLKVQLEGNITGIVNASTDADGNFFFTSIPAGNYIVIVDAGGDYEPVREPVTIYGTSAFGSYSASQTINVPIHLRLKGSAKTSHGPSVLFADVPPKALDLYSSALESSSKRNHKKAIEQLNSAIAIHPAFGPAFSELGAEYLMVNEPDKAIEPLQAAIRLLPKEFLPRLNYGIALWNQRKASDAEMQLREALTLNNSSSIGHYYLGVALLSQQKIEEAKEELLAAIKNGGDKMPQVHKYLGGIYWKNKQLKEAADELEKYIQLDPKAPDAGKIRDTIKELRSKQ